MRKSMKEDFLDFLFYVDIRNIILVSVSLFIGAMLGSFFHIDRGNFTQFEVMVWAFIIVCLIGYFTWAFFKSRKAYWVYTLTILFAAIKQPEKLNDIASFIGLMITLSVILLILEYFEIAKDEKNAKRTNKKVNRRKKKNKAKT